MPLNFALIQKGTEDEEVGLQIYFSPERCFFSKDILSCGLHSVTWDLHCIRVSFLLIGENSVENGFTCLHCHQPSWEQPPSNRLEKEPLAPPRAPMFTDAGGSSLKCEQQLLCLVWKYKTGANTEKVTLDYQIFMNLCFLNILQFWISLSTKEAPERLRKTWSK